MLNFFNYILYVQLSPERLTIRNPRTGEMISERPEVAISEGAKRTIVASGTAARAALTEPTVKLVNPFAHPRSLVSDFTVGEQVLKAFVRRIGSGRLLTVSPEVVMHPQGDPEGGLTQIEIRAIRELALGAGAGEVRIWQGRTLTDDELLARHFPAEGRLLD